MDASSYDNWSLMLNMIFLDNIIFLLGQQKFSLKQNV